MNTDCRGQVRISIWGCQSTVKCYGHIRVQREPVGHPRGEYDIWHRAEVFWTTQTPCFKRTAWETDNTNIWVTNRAFQQKNRRTGIMRKTVYRILVFTECKQKHILTKSRETLERMLLTYLSCSDFHQLRLNSNPRAPIVAGSQTQYGLRADLQCCVRDSALVVGSLL